MRVIFKETITHVVQELYNYFLIFIFLFYKTQKLSYMYLKLHIFLSLSLSLFLALIFLNSSQGKQNLANVASSYLK